MKIITLEDPVEYKLQGVNQSQIEHSKDYTFAKGLRSILRQDPDIVMVGEIRDLETAEIAIQAALTGHLVVSTIHTNSAAGAIPRFLSMGVQPFLLARRSTASLANVSSNASIRDEKPLITSPRAFWPKSAPNSETPPRCPCGIQGGFGPSPSSTAQGRRQSPTKGRLGIYEIFPMNAEIEALILSGKVSEYDMIAIAQKSGMVTMAQDGCSRPWTG